MNKAALGWELKILVVIAAIFSIIYAKPILFPLVVSFILYLLLSPLVEVMARIKIPRTLASALIVGLLLVIASSAISVLVQPATDWIDHAPESFSKIEKKFKYIKSSLGKLNKAADTAQELTADNNVNKIEVVTHGTSLGYSIFDLTTNFLLLISTILLFIFFLLIYFPALIQNLERILYERRRIVKENAYIVRLKNEVSAYLFTFTLICAGLGTVVAFVFWLLGLPNYILWGAMAMFLTFIPYIGHLIGIITILFVSLTTFDSYFYIFTPPIVYFLLTVLEGQIITPIFLGSRLNLNPLIVFLSMFIWSGMWGIGGIFISVPLLIAIKITMEKIPSLSKYTALLEK